MLINEVPPGELPGMVSLLSGRMPDQSDPREVLDRETCHAGSQTHLKRLKSNADAYLCVRSGPWP